MTRTRAPRPLTAALALLAATGSLSAQQPSQPIFRARTDVVLVDVTATDGRGVPVTGLTAEDFEVLEDDRPVDIVEFKAVDLPRVTSAPSSLPRDLSGAVLSSNDRPLDVSVRHEASSREVAFTVSGYNPAVEHGSSTP